VSKLTGGGQALPPIFVGGTGRSGTTVTGSLLGRHPDYVVLPAEAKFHAAPRALPEWVAGKLSAPEFAEQLLGEHEVSLSRGGGLSKIVDRARLQDALDDLSDEPEDGRVEAARRFMEAVLGGYADAHDRRGWVEMTPRSIMHARLLLKLFPEAKLVHVMRDGRDVAASLVAKRWHDDPFHSLVWWETRMRQAHRATRMVPETSCHILRFDRLMQGHREETLNGLLRFLGWSGHPELTRFFTEEMTEDRAHIGRWRTEIRADQLERFTTSYAEAIDRLQNEGVPVP
jgi:hypothetical protein